jgi:hypothetical protein
MAAAWLQPASSRALQGVSLILRAAAARPALPLASGAPLGAWLRLLRRYGPCIDWLRFWQRAAFLTAMACLNSMLGLVDTLLYGRAIAAQRLHEEPLIVLGHPRTGTTHVHNLLALDPR